MANNQTKSSALNYAAFGLNPTTDTSGQVTPACFPKYDSFEGGHEIKEEDDTGHTGQKITLLTKDRVSAEGAPSWEDKIRFGEGIEDVWYWCLGDYDEPVAAVAGATIAKKFVFYQSADGDMPMGTVMQGANVDGLSPDAFVNCVGNQLELTMDADKSPTYKFTGLSDFPFYNQVEPTLVFPSVEYKLMAGQKTVYMGPVNTVEASLKNDTYKIDCSTTASLELNNNFESSVCDGVQFGQPNKDQKAWEGNGKFEMNANDANINLEAEWATGSSSGTEVTTESLRKALLFSYVGSKKIETVGGTPTVDIYPQMDIYIPSANIKFTRDRDGDDAMKVSAEFDIINPGSVTPVKTTIITNLAALHFGTAV